MSDWDFGRVIESTASGRAWLRKRQNVGGSFVSGFLEYIHFREHLHNVCDACKEHDAYPELLRFFRDLGFGEEFDHAWQWGVFDAWTWEPTPDHLEDLVDVVRFGRY